MRNIACGSRLSRAWRLTAPARFAALFSLATAACADGPTDPANIDAVEFGKRLFMEETFGGNGRTCGTCHPPENDFAIDANFVATVSPEDPLFVFEALPALKGLEDGRLLRRRGLVLSNADGYDRPHLFRSVPSLINVAYTAPYGWSGEHRTLGEIAAAAVEQHYPITLERVPGVDFREPTGEELEAITAFMKSVTSGHDPDLIEDPTPGNLAPLLATEEERHGMDLFFGRGRCAACHSGPALAFPDPNGPFASRAPFFDNRGKNREGRNVLPVNREDGLPPDDGDGQGRFNTANLLGMRRAQQAFFHDNAVAGSLRDEIEAYTGEVFAGSPPGRELGGIELTDEEIDAILAFLSAINDPQREGH